jgi:hypothetical protein
MNGFSGNEDSELGLSRIRVSSFGFEVTMVIGSSRKAFFHQSSFPPLKRRIGPERAALTDER